MAHIKSRSYRTKDNKETLFDKHGRILGKYDSISESEKAAKLISKTAETKPRRKPKYKPKTFTQIKKANDDLVKKMSRQ